MVSVACILACHNRKELTIRCIEQLRHEATAEVSITFYVLDDGSSDGTREALAAQSDIHLLLGDGSYFWTAGMAEAFQAAITDRHDYYLWVNDDVAFDEGFLEKLLATHDRMEARFSNGVIVVGACRSAETGRATYGGFHRIRSMISLQFEFVPPTDEPQIVDTFNGNCVLIDSRVVEKIGGLDAKFFHNLGDIDYGLRATKAKAGIVLSAGTVGICEPNATKVKTGEIIRKGSLRARWALLKKPQYFHLPSWFRITRRHVRPFWPIAALRPLLRYVGV